MIWRIHISLAVWSGHYEGMKFFFSRGNVLGRSFAF